ncbi:MAG: hypothetical protein ACOC3A_02465 [Thermodesulfobacteriota bacterium]
MMAKRPKTEEQYTKGNEILNFVIYNSTTIAGDDEVLQHKILGSETAHITLHPDGSVNFRIKRTKSYLEHAIRSNLRGFTPNPSARLK